MKQILCIKLKDPKYSMVDHSTYANPSIRDIKRSVDKKVGKGTWSRVYLGNGLYMTPSYKVGNVFKEAAE